MTQEVKNNTRREIMIGLSFWTFLVAAFAVYGIRTLNDYSSPEVGVGDVASVTVNTEATPTAIVTDSPTHNDDDSAVGDDDDSAGSDDDTSDDGDDDDDSAVGDDLATTSANTYDVAVKVSTDFCIPYGDAQLINIVDKTICPEEDGQKRCFWLFQCVGGSEEDSYHQALCQISEDRHPTVCLAR